MRRRSATPTLTTPTPTPPPPPPPRLRPSAERRAAADAIDAAAAAAAAAAAVVVDDDDDVDDADVASLSARILAASDASDADRLIDAEARVPALYLNYSPNYSRYFLETRDHFHFFCFS